MAERRTVISLSVSPRNPDAATVAEALKERGIAITHGGGQILAWAAAYLSGRAADPPPIVDQGPSEEELDQLLDDF
jgi:hypothetical protein